MTVVRSGWIPQFGEVVVNTLASERNPLRTGLFVRVVTIPRGRTNAGRHWELTDGKGEFWMVRPENCRSALIDGSGCDAGPRQQTSNSGYSCMTQPTQIAESVRTCPHCDGPAHPPLSMCRGDLSERLHRAVDRLGGLASDPSLGMLESARLRGKIEGVKLALSYLNEPPEGARYDGQVSREE